MNVVSIERVTKDRSRVKFENGETLILYQGEIRIYRIKEGSDISDEVYSVIVCEVLPKRAKLRAMNLLKARDYTEYQLRTKLLEGGYPIDIVNQAIEYVKSYGYVDDNRYALCYIKEQMCRRSRKEIYQKLVVKGISRDIIDRAFYEVNSSLDSDADTYKFDERDAIVKLLLKKRFTGDETYEEKQKLLAFFYRKGFEIDSVYKAMDFIQCQSK